MIKPPMSQRSEERPCSKRPAAVTERDRWPFFAGNSLLKPRAPCLEWTVSVTEMDGDRGLPCLEWRVSVFEVDASVTSIDLID